MAGFFDFLTATDSTPRGLLGGNNLSAAAGSFANAETLGGALFGGLTGLLTGQRTDRVGQTYEALRRLLPEDVARAAATNPALAQTALQSVLNPQYGFQTLPDGTIIRTDPRRGTVQPIYSAPKPPTYGVIGKDQFGNEQYGWIDPTRRTTTPGVPGGIETAPLPAPGAAPSAGAIPAPPPGVNPKVWRDEQTRIAADAAGGKLTETQANSTTFANRMENAEAEWSKVSPKIEAGGWGVTMDRIARGVTEGAYNPIPQGATNWMLSPEFQQGEVAKSQFITAMLRKESGAAIAPSEFERYNREFFPQAGDSSEVIRQKAQARKVAIEAMKKGAGPGYKSPTVKIGNVTIERID